MSCRSSWCRGAHHHCSCTTNTGVCVNLLDDVVRRNRLQGEVGRVVREHRYAVRHNLVVPVDYVLLVYWVHQGSHLGRLVLRGYVLLRRNVLQRPAVRVWMHVRVVPVVRVA